MSGATTPSTTLFITESESLALFNRGPITAALTPPASCLETLTLGAADGSMYFGHFGNPYLDTSCYPLGTLRGQDFFSGSSWDVYYYSPAICPPTWTTATVFGNVFQGISTMTILSFDSKTTAALCCPDGYSYNIAGHQCTSAVTEGQNVGYVFPTFLGASGWDRGALSYSTYASAAYVVGDGVPIWWQSSDLALLASASTVSPATTLDASTTNTATTGAMTTGSIAQTSPTASVPTSTSTSLPTSLPTNPPHSGGSSGLSTGAKIGIGIGIPLAIFLGLAIGFLFSMRRRHLTTDGSVGHGLGANGEHKPGALYHSDSRSIHEMHTDPEQYHNRHELPHIV